MYVLSVTGTLSRVVDSGKQKACFRFIRFISTRSDCATDSHGFRYRGETNFFPLSKFQLPYGRCSSRPESIAYPRASCLHRRCNNIDVAITMLLAFFPAMEEDVPDTFQIVKENATRENKELREIGEDNVLPRPDSTGYTVLRYSFIASVAVYRSTESSGVHSIPTPCRRIFVRRSCVRE